MKKCTPNIMVDDMERTVEFYKTVLGFEPVITVPQSQPWNWVLMKCDQVEVMFQTRRSLSEELPLFKHQPKGGALTFHIELEGVQALYTRLQAKAADIVSALHSTFYGTEEFSLRDCNDFILTFAQR